jgi:hypothetical protein
MWVHKRKFAFFPTWCGGVWVWLEFYKLSFKWVLWGGWHKEDVSCSVIYGPESDAEVD